MNDKPMMMCGHAANATTGDGKPSCVICAGLTPDALIVNETPPLFLGRMARCSYYNTLPKGRNHEGPERDGCKKGNFCLCEKPSNTNLAFFQHNPTREYDEFYCGCYGWD